MRVERVPGREERYSNGGYLIVAQLLEDTLGKPFDAVMQESVFGPCGMTSSSFEQALSPALAGRAASAHGWDVETWQEVPGQVAPGKWRAQDVGMSGLWTTAPDLARFTAEIMRAYAGRSERVLSQEMTRRILTSVAAGIPLQEPFTADQALGFSIIYLGSERYMIHIGGSFPGYVSALIAQPERGFGVVVMTNAWSGYELIWEVLYRVLYAYGIFPTTGQALGMAYSLLLVLAALVVAPVGLIRSNAGSSHAPGSEHEPMTGNLPRVARSVVLLTVAAILVLTLLYRGPLGGNLIHALDRGETVMTKAVLGVFFSSPLILLVLTGLIWRRGRWTRQERVQYTVLVLGALTGIYLLRDLWGLMFWG